MDEQQQTPATVPAESLRSKIIVAIVETLVFGALLSALGYWFNIRLEEHKEILNKRLEEYKGRCPVAC